MKTRNDATRTIILRTNGEEKKKRKCKCKQDLEEKNNLKYIILDVFNIIISLTTINIS
jgi:hypothetical protein